MLLFCTKWSTEKNANINETKAKQSQIFNKIILLIFFPLIAPSQPWTAGAFSTSYSQFIYCMRYMKLELLTFIMEYWTPPTLKYTHRLIYHSFLQLLVLLTPLWYVVVMPITLWQTALPQHSMSSRHQQQKLTYRNSPLKPSGPLCENSTLHTYQHWTPLNLFAF